MKLLLQQACKAQSILYKLQTIVINSIVHKINTDLIVLLSVVEKQSNDIEKAVDVRERS